MKWLTFAGAACAFLLAGCSDDSSQATDAAPVSITSFTASPNTISVLGTPVTLAWALQGTPAFLIITADNNSGPGEVAGTRVTVNPVKTTTYTLAATAQGQTVRANTTVTVTTPPPSPTPPTPDPPEYDGPDLRYWVRSDCGKVSTTYATEDGGTAQRDFGNGYVYTAQDVLRDTFLYISAQNQCARGDVTVRIYTDGEIYKETTSSGAYVIATASGTY